MRKLSIVGSLVFLLSAAAIAQGPLSSVVDPFFLIDYNPAIVHFKSIPAILSDRCKALQNFYADGWVYGHLKTADAEYFITYGYVKVDLEDGHSSIVVPEEDDGLAIEVRGQGCRVDRAQFFLRKQLNPAKNATPIEVSDSVLDAIAADIVDRYVQAFGGKQKFLMHVTAFARNGLPPVVQKQLEKVERE